ncbi:MAG TPA: hypothetical protein PKD24_00140 [Pyrinomonadaceae bacterium]|nr:hypothetical protein [Pyrinomonadaceae bacterium]HMP64437.1 hypothetical protein [Pyrinomonadaceae bacterium]
MKLLVPTSLVFVVASLVISIAASQGFLYKNTSETTSTQGSKQTVSAQPTPPEKDENAKQTDVGSLLNARIESLIKEKEPEWKLVKNDWASWTETSYRVWTYRDKEVTVSTNAYETVEQAKRTFEKSKSLLWVSSGSPGREIEEFGDEGAFLRSNDGRPIPSSLTFSIGKFHVLITGETSDVLRFAKHIEAVLRAL